jgi:uncharacterized protein (TIGR04255 family)
MSLEALHAYAGDHSIQNATFMFQWGRHLTSAELSNFEQLHPFVKDQLPVFESQTGTQFTVSPAGVQTQEAGVFAVKFSRQGAQPAAAPAASLEFMPDRCVIVINDYSRWANVWPEVSNWMKIVAQFAVNQFGMTAIGLAYVDSFHWRRNPAELDYSEVFSVNTKYVPKLMLETKGLWHSHNGYFIDAEGPIRHRTLENVNVNAIDGVGERVIQLQTSQQMNMQAVIWNLDAVLECIDTIIPQYHERNKDILIDLLSPQVRKMIHLEATNAT